jgi:hypothetical protein
MGNTCAKSSNWTKIHFLSEPEVNVSLEIKRFRNLFFSDPHSCYNKTGVQGYSGLSDDSVRSQIFLDINEKIHRYLEIADKNLKSVN